MKLSRSERERAWGLGSSMMELLRERGKHIGTSREEQAAIIGAEMLVGKMLDRTWSFEKRLGKWVKVIWHERQDARLIVNDAEDDKVVLVLAVGKFDQYEVPGYITQGEAKQVMHRVELAKDWTPNVVEQDHLLRIVPHAQATCGMPKHRDFWRSRGTRSKPPGPWVCTICHPCPWDPTAPGWAAEEWQIEHGRVPAQRR